MKYALLLSFLLSCCCLNAQTTQVPLPEFVDMVMQLKTDNTLANLDKTDIIVESKLTGSRRYIIHLKAQGNKAKVLLSGSPDNKYIATIQPGIDPEAAIELFKFEEVSKNRKILIASISGGWGKTKDVTLPKQTLNYKKVQNGSYIISPANQLQPGEYVFLVNRPNISELGGGGKAFRGYCFSVE